MRRRLTIDNIQCKLVEVLPSEILALRRFFRLLAANVASPRDARNVGLARVADCDLVNGLAGLETHQSNDAIAPADSKKQSYVICELQWSGPCISQACPHTIRSPSESVNRLPVAALAVLGHYLPIGSPYLQVCRACNSSEQLNLGVAGD